VYDLLQKSGIPAGIVQTGDDLTRDPQLGYRKFYWALDHPAGIGQFTYSGFPARMSRTGYSIRRAPMLGEHNEYVATRILGLTDREFLDLLEQGVFE
jgi:crotonobetainyl-CoA:carnitine CoA-transferase CaiB-like acyl-CoA transferase